MLRKHRQVLILLVGLLYVYSVCPLLCAAFEQKFCHDVSQKVISGDTETQSICCQRTKTGAVGEAEVPSESGKSCCLTNLELVLPADRYNTHESREPIEQSLVSILPISATLPVVRRESSRDFLEPLISTFFVNHPLSRRGPPYSLSYKKLFSC